MKASFSDAQEELKHIPLSQISLNPYQPRREFNLKDLEELAQSIRTVGLLHPPLVRPLPESGGYELISGERRLRAAQLASLTTIPVYIRNVSNSHSAQSALIENIQRIDLNPLEIAKCLKSLMVEFGFTQDHLSQQIGKKRSTVANYLRLLTLPESLQESLGKGMMTMGHAKAILALDKPDKQERLHALILQNNLTVRQAEQAAKRFEEKNKKNSQLVKRDCYLEEIVNGMREKMGTQVSIQVKGLGGQIKIDYYSLDDLDRLMEILGTHE